MFLFIEVDDYQDGLIGIIGCSHLSRCRGNSQERFIEEGSLTGVIAIVASNNGDPH